MSKQDIAEELNETKSYLKDMFGKLKSSIKGQKGGTQKLNEDEVVKIKDDEAKTDSPTT